MKNSMLFRSLGSPAIAVMIVLAVGHGRASAFPPDLAAKAKARESIKKALDYFVSVQNAEGAWQAFDKSHPSITALIVKAIADDADFGPKHSAAIRGIEYVLRFVQPDGGIYRPEDGQPNYQTSVALVALAVMRDERHKDAIRNAQDFLKKLQWDDGEGHETSSPWFGGAGYGKHKRPDLSNTQLMLEALKDSGLSADDPVYQKALVFVSRSQMLDATNDQPLADGASDGGFVYTPANNGESMAGVESVDDRTRLRSYGSMTYAGFKSLLYAKVDRNDERVVNALKWIRGHYSLDANPNMPAPQAREGLYYYYHVFAKALAAWGEETLTDDRGVAHRWREELIEKLAKDQRPDGSWVNEADRWFEGNPHLVTAYAVLAMQTALE